MYEYCGMAVACDGSDAFYVNGATVTATTSLDAGNELGADGWRLATSAMLVNDGGSFLLHTFERVAQ